jgi:hypothetical protein
MGFGPNLAEVLIDISQNGAYLLVKGKIEVGTEMEVGLLGMGHSRPIKLLGTVVRAEPVDEEHTRVAIRFVKHLKYVDFQHLT